MIDIEIKAMKKLGDRLTSQTLCVSSPFHYIDAEVVYSYAEETGLTDFLTQFPKSNSI